jgi:hypothetical protein
MIRYALVCKAGHEFESWFASADSYESQEKRGLVACPSCGDARVSRAIMAPAVARRDRDRPTRSEATPAGAEAPQAETPAPVAVLDEKQRALRQMMRALRAEIVEKTEDLGRRFPDEARRMHEGEAPRRSIRGEATAEEARALIEDGVEILPLPPLPDERN